MTTTPRPPKPALRFGPALWARIQQNSDIRVRRAVITSPSHVEHDGVAIVTGLASAPRLILTLGDAYELAEALASVIDGMTGAERELRRPAEADQVLEANLAEAFADETGISGADV